MQDPTSSSASGPTLNAPDIVALWPSASTTEPVPEISEAAGILAAPLRSSNAPLLTWTVPPARNPMLRIVVMPGSRVSPGAAAVNTPVLVNAAPPPKFRRPVAGLPGSLAFSNVLPTLVIFQVFGRGSGDERVDLLAERELAVDVAAGPQESAAALHGALARQRRLVATPRAGIELELGLSCNSITLFLTDSPCVPGS